MTSPRCQRLRAAGTRPAVAALLAAALGAAGDDLAGAWDLAARWLPNEAHARFAAAPPTREADFGRAVTLLNVQPKTRGNLDEAARLFERVAAADGSDELGVAARYGRARLEQVHRFEPEPARALELYDRLAADRPDHPLAQQAVVKACLLRLFDPESPAPPAQRLAEAAARGAGLADPGARRDFHLLMAGAIGEFGGAEADALGHLLAADAAGFARRQSAADAWVRIGELARRTGRSDVAAEYYGRFLAAFPRDARVGLVRQRLAGLAGAAAAGGREGRP